MKDVAHFRYGPGDKTRHIHTHTHTHMCECVWVILKTHIYIHTVGGFKTLQQVLKLTLTQLCVCVCVCV